MPPGVLQLNASAAWLSAGRNRPRTTPASGTPT